MVMEGSGDRADGRGPEEFRPPFLSTRVISQAKGSAYLEAGKTKVMVGVYGPRPAERKFGFSETGRLEVEVSMTSFAMQSGLSRQQLLAHKKSMAEAVHSALSASVQLHLMPKACVHVYVMLLEAGGSDLASAVTAASVALADAGIAMFDLVPACLVVKMPGSRLLLDPSSEEEAAGEGRVLMALMPSSNQVTQLLMQGSWSEVESREVLELSMGACMQLKTAMRDVLVQAAAGTSNA